jgi:hypothetical protein
MKPTRKILLGSLILIGLQFLLSSCLTDAYVGVGTGVYYGPGRDPWFRDDPWMDGHRWYGGPPISTSVGIYIYPPRHRR